MVTERVHAYPWYFRMETRPELHSRQGHLLCDITLKYILAYYRDTRLSNEQYGMCTISIGRKRREQVSFILSTVIYCLFCMKWNTSLKWRETPWQRGSSGYFTSNVYIEGDDNDWGRPRVARHRRNISSYVREAGLCSSIVQSTNALSYIGSAWYLKCVVKFRERKLNISNKDDSRNMSAGRPAVHVLTSATQPSYGAPEN